MRKRAGRLLAAALALGAAACTVPTLAQLEAEAPRACNAEHPCAAGYDCAGGICTPGGAQECTPGTTADCGSAVGECAPGSRLCGDDGKPGACVGEVGPVAEVCNGRDEDCDGATDEGLLGAACTLTAGVCAGARAACTQGVFEQPCGAASYGAGWQAAESTCDGLDNDCDGQVDEALTAPCASQAGVCAGSTQSCTGSVFPGCSASTYAAWSSAWEGFESRCDGLDNDCDGRVDRWDAANLSLSAGARSRGAVAVAVDGGVLVLHEEGTRILARVARADGTFGTALQPSASIAGATLAYAPALAGDGTVLAAAWVEERPAKAVLLATLGADGRSNLVGGSSLAVLNTGSPVALALAVDAAAGRLLLAVEDAAGASTIKLVGYPTALPPAGGTTFVQDLAAPGARAPHVAAAGGGTFYVVFEGPGGIERRVVDAAGNVTVASTLGAAGDRSPQALHLGADGGGLFATYYVAAPGDGGQDRIAVATCDGGAACSTTGFGGTFPPGMAQLRVAAPARGAPASLAVWTQGSANPTVRFRAVVASDGGELLGTVSAAGRRAVPVLLAGGAAAVVWDTGDAGAAADGGFAADEVFVGRLCLP